MGLILVSTKIFCKKKKEFFVISSLPFLLCYISIATFGSTLFKCATFCLANKVIRNIGNCIFGDDFEFLL